MSAPEAPSRPVREPWAYFLTIACYGARLHGSPKGSVHRSQNAPGTHFLAADPALERAERRSMRQPPARLEIPARRLALESILDTCAFRRWTLHAAHVRTNHLHVVLAAPAEPAELLQKLKTA